MFALSQLALARPNATASLRARQCANSAAAESCCVRLHSLLFRCPHSPASRALPSFSAAFFAVNASLFSLCTLTIFFHRNLLVELLFFLHILVLSASASDRLLEGSIVVGNFNSARVRVPRKPPHSLLLLARSSCRVNSAFRTQFVPKSSSMDCISEGVFYGRHHHRHGAVRLQSSFRIVRHSITGLTAATSSKSMSMVVHKACKLIAAPPDFAFLVRP